MDGDCSGIYDTLAGTPRRVHQYGVSQLQDSLCCGTLLDKLLLKAREWPERETAFLENLRPRSGQFIKQLELDTREIPKARNGRPKWRADSVPILKQTRDPATTNLGSPESEQDLHQVDQYRREVVHAYQLIRSKIGDPQQRLK